MDLMYYEVLKQQNAYSFSLCLILLGLLALGIIGIFSTRKSMRYRKEVMDMYVSSKTKKLARDEGLDLVEEYELFKKWLRKSKLESSTKELDEFIEDDLKEKLSDKVLKKESKK